MKNLQKFTDQTPEEIWEPKLRGRVLLLDPARRAPIPPSPARAEGPYFPNPKARRNAGLFLCVVSGRRSARLLMRRSVQYCVAAPSSLHFAHDRDTDKRADSGRPEGRAMSMVAFRRMAGAGEGS